MAYTTDFQRQRLYDWEHLAFPKWSTQTMTLDECRELATELCAIYGREKPNIEPAEWGQQRALAHGSWKVSLPKWAQNPIILAHELAHTISPCGTHGPKFCRIYARLLSHLTGHTVAVIVNDMRAHGLRVGDGDFVDGLGKLESARWLKLYGELSKIEGQLRSLRQRDCMVTKKLELIGRLESEWGVLKNRLSTPGPVFLKNLEPMRGWTKRMDKSRLEDKKPYYKPRVFQVEHVLAPGKINLEVIIKGGYKVAARGKK